MKKTTGIILYITIILGAAFLIRGNISYAAADNNQIALASAGDSAINTDLDIESRKQILRDVLETSQTEISDLKSKLTNLKLDNSDWGSLRDNLINKLSDFQDHYNNIQDEINSTSSPLTIDDVKSLARDLKDWRENTYSPELDKITSMILIFKSNDILNITQSRIDKISSDIEKLDKQHIIKTDSLKDYLSQASKHLQNAKTIIEKSKKLYFESMTVSNFQDNQDNATTTDTTAQSADTANKQTDVQGMIRNMTKDSLKELKATYEIFFQMNDAIK